MRILQILPGFEEGGVERHVLWLSNELARRGHEVTVLSSGGRLEASLKNAEHWTLPVQRKNIFTGLYCAIRIAIRAKQENWQIFHSHSRVPSWIAWWASCMTGIPFVITAHSFYSLNIGLYPLKKADSAISVSYSVSEYLKKFLPENEKVIYNGLPPVKVEWRGSPETGSRFLFIGRLTRLKGVHILLKALAGAASLRWSLDIVGDGPQRQDLETLTNDLGLSERVNFRGFQDNTDQWLAECSCFVFPSLEEGMGLTLMRAVQMGVPVIASDLPAVRELTGSPETLVEPGSTERWEEALESFLRSGRVSKDFKRDLIMSQVEAVEKIEQQVYIPLLS